MFISDVAEDVGRLEVAAAHLALNVGIGAHLQPVGQHHLFEVLAHLVAVHVAVGDVGQTDVAPHLQEVGGWLALAVARPLAVLGQGGEVGEEAARVRRVAARRRGARLAVQAEVASGRGRGRSG